MQRSIRYVALLMTAVLGAQQPTAPPAAKPANDQPFTFKSSSNLIVVNVTVRDKSGKAMTGLKAEDFEIFEDEKRQPLTVFESQSLAGEALPTLAPTFAERKDVTAPPAKDDAEFAPTRFRDRRLMVMLFDFSSMQPAEQIRAQKAAEKFLREQMTTSDMVEIMTFTNDINVVQEFTDDRDLLIKTVRTFLPGQMSELAVNADDPDAEEAAASGLFQADESEFNIFNTDRKLGALETAVKKLTVLPEKKALIYFSSGVGKTGVENQSQLRSTINAAVRSNVSFYPVDARGLVATPPAGDATVASQRGSGVFSGRTQTSARTKFNDQQETLYSLAADTGGKALLDNNDLTMGIKQAQKDINSYYILGYYTNNTAQDGRYRKIRVKLASQLQAKLDYRDGYYASKVWKNFNSNDKERQLEEALQLGDPATELPVALEIDYFRLAKDKYFVPVSVKIPGNVLTLVKKGSNEQSELDFLGQIRDVRGRTVGSVRDTIKVKLAEQTAEQLKQRQLQYDTGFMLPPGAYVLRFLARENQNGKMGTFETKFVIPDLASQDKGMKLSSVIWSNQREPLKAAVGAADNNKKLTALHPLVKDGFKLVPSITRVFRKDQSMYVYFEVYDAMSDPTAKVPSVAATLSLFRGKSKAFESAPVRLTELAANRGNMVPFQFQLPLAKLVPGNYTAQVNVLDELGRKFAFPRASVVVLP